VVKAIEHYTTALRCWKFLEGLPVEGIFLTFTDRLLSGYSLLWLLDSKVPPINFISMGERVPEDILRVDKEHLIKLFLKGIEED
jgi:flagellar biosynthesis protein FlhF